MNTAEAPRRFGGWWRAEKGHRWQRLVEAADYARALGELLDVAARRAPGELLVTEGDPNECEAAPARRRRRY